VDEVQVDVEQLGKTVGARHQMALPDLVEEGATHGSKLAPTYGDKQVIVRFCSETSLR
jgi:hypothetical protein